MNSFGTLYRLTTFGESHGPAIGGVIDGMSAGFPIDCEAVQRELDRRRPGTTPGSSARRETDRVQFLSGIFEGRTLGTPIGFIIPNTDAQSADYEAMRDLFRPNHADFTYQAKYGIRDFRGGGRASARETACRVVAGAVARQILSREGIVVQAFTQQIGDVAVEELPPCAKFPDVYADPMRCPDPEVSARMTEAVSEAASEGDTLGGCVHCFITGLPAGLGEPIYGKLQAMLASAMLSIPAAKGFEYGIGFQAPFFRGSEVMDRFALDPATGAPCLKSNFSGGIQGGISNGAPVSFRVAFKPVATLMRHIECMDRFGRVVNINPAGRHDVCVVPRAVPVVEAMACCVVLDAYLLDSVMLTPPDPQN